jgi:hypothetical protein
VPFREPRPAWCERAPALAASALALDDDALSLLDGDDAARLNWLAAHVPAVAAIGPLLHFAPPAAAGAIDSRLVRDVPGRKLAQIAAFAASAAPTSLPLVEWCAGKGHLGRVLGLARAKPVLSIEADPALCRAGERLAARVGADQRFLAADVLCDAARNRTWIDGRHAIGLHACGELHRALLEAAASARPPALDLAPCCFHKVADAARARLAGVGRLRPLWDDLRLSVADTATASAREVAMRRREMAWKLGFDALQRRLSDADRHHPLAPLPDDWLRGDFEAFCRHVALRERLELRGTADWDRWEAEGWRRRAEVVRFDQVRKAFRRAIELWLVLDRASFLERCGYSVRVSEFCARSVTPRNLLISARL